jgi:hypothetical protein
MGRIILNRLFTATTPSLHCSFFELSTRSIEVPRWFSAWWKVFSLASRHFWTRSKKRKLLTRITAKLEIRNSGYRFELELVPREYHAFRSEHHTAVQEQQSRFQVDKNGMHTEAALDCNTGKVFDDTSPVRWTRKVAQQTFHSNNKSSCLDIYDRSMSTNQTEWALQRTETANGFRSKIRFFNISHCCLSYDWHMQSS